MHNVLKLTHYWKNHQKPSNVHIVWYKELLQITSEWVRATRDTTVFSPPFLFFYLLSLSFYLWPITQGDVHFCDLFGVQIHELQKFMV